MENIQDTNQTDEQLERHEEVQAIIDRMPTKGAIWVAIITGILISVVFVLGFIIKYPDTVDGQVSITALYAPIRLVANSTGKIHLLKENKNLVREGEVIAYIESGVNYKDVLRLDSLLTSCDASSLRKLPLPVKMTLGELSSSFSSFMVAYAQYRRFLESDIYKTRCSSLQYQIEVDGKIVQNVEHAQVLKEQLLQIENNRTRKDSLLASGNAISEEEYDRQHLSLLSQKDAYESFRSEKLSRYSQISKNKMELKQLTLEELESKDKLYADVLARENDLANAIRLWKEKYLQYAPVGGEVEFLGFWRENGFVQSGQELFSIIPTKNEMLGEVLIPAHGVGKVKLGQTANIKIENYPYDEYGLIRGKVESISRLSNKMQTADGKNSNAYRVMISFPDGMQTNFGKELALDFESIGNVEIVTKRKRLIERLFDNLKAKTEK